MKLSTVPVTEIQKVLVYGAPKTGKTELVGQLARDFPLVWFDLESGFKTLQKLPQSAQENIELIRLPDTKEWPIAIETCLKVMKPGEKKICNAHGKILCAKCVKEPPEAFTVLDLFSLPRETIVVFDSISQLAISALANIFKNELNDLLDAPETTWKDWGKQGFLMDRFFTNVQQASFSIICIGHDVDISKENESTKLTAQGGTRNFSRNMGKFFDHVVYCDVKAKAHKFHSSTTDTSFAITGSRLEVDMETMDKPSLKPIFDGSWKANLEKSQRKEVVNALSKLNVSKPGLNVKR